jgi:hypothetical protein
MTAVTELANDVGTSAACQALPMPRASYYRDRRKTFSLAVTASRPSPARALRPAERETVFSSFARRTLPRSLAGRCLCDVAR